MTWIARVLVVALGCALLCSCGARERQLQGRWQSEEGGYVNHFELHADGSFSAALDRSSVTPAQARIGSYSGTWKCTSSRFEGRVLQSDVPLLPAGYVWSNEIVEYSSEQLVMRTTSGHEETWRRIKE